MFRFFVLAWSCLLDGRRRLVTTRPVFVGSRRHCRCRCGREPLESSPSQAAKQAPQEGQARQQGTSAVPYGRGFRPVPAQQRREPTPPHEPTHFGRLRGGCALTPGAETAAAPAKTPAAPRGPAKGPKGAQPEPQNLESRSPGATCWPVAAGALSAAKARCGEG